MRNQLYDILKKSFNSFIGNMHTALPGRIESYIPAQKKANVKPLIKKKINNLQILPLPVITNVPVVFPGTNNAVLSFPLNPGDGCLIIFSERSMERFLSSVGEDVEPQDPRRFSLTDAICIPGLFPFPQPGKTGTGTSVELLNDIGFVDIQGSNNFAVLFNQLKTAFDNLLNAFNTHVHGGVTPGGGSTATPTPVSTAVIDNAKSTKVRLG